MFLRNLNFQFFSNSDSFKLKTALPNIDRAICKGHKFTIALCCRIYNERYV